MVNGDPIRFGILGTLIIISLNLFGYYYLQQPAAVPFQAGWWSTWFPVYIVWFISLLVGAVIRFRSRKKK